MNSITDFSQGKAGFEALEGAVENRFKGAVGPFGIKMNYLGGVFHNPRLFRKSEERRCPVSLASVYSNVAYCVDSIAETICSPSPFRGVDGEKRVQYTIQILAEQRERLRKRLTQKLRKVSPVRIPFVQRIQAIFH